jgi:hypothetical protein
MSQENPLEMVVLPLGQAKLDRARLLLAPPTFQEGREFLDGAGIRDRKRLLFLPGLAALSNDRELSPPDAGEAVAGYAAISKGLPNLEQVCSAR